jgi:hypothetical protein
MTKALKVTFGVHAVVALLFGVPLLVVPGRFLGLFGWLPVDPLITRLLGAAMLALSWGSFRGYRTTDASMQLAFIQMEVIYTILGAVGLLRHLLIAWYPWYVWTLFAILAVFAITWLFFLWKRR